MAGLFLKYQEELEPSFIILVMVEEIKYLDTVDPYKLHDVMQQITKKIN